AASGSARKDSTVTTAAVTTRTAVGETLPCRPAATVPSAKSAPKPVTRAKGAASPRCLELFISYPSQAPETLKLNDLDRSLTPRSGVLTRPLHRPGAAALSFEGSDHGGLVKAGYDLTGTHDGG